MVFSSLTFLCIFLPATIILSYLIKPVRGKNILLVIASLLFYAYGEPVYIILMIASICINYMFGRLLGSGNRKAKLALAVTVNIGLLFVFKYAAWIINGLSGLLDLGIPAVELSLPIGISFYTFQALSYVIDVYRGVVEPQKSILNFFLFISFFPQLIAGPIIKYKDIAKELANRQMTTEGMAHGLQRFIFGLSKKVLIANVMASAADTVFALNTSELCAVSAWAGAIAYMMQIYFDFSGYSDMAIGMGEIFGFHFMENFRYPYAADCIQDFWHRWHISLSTWFKEYLYIPLGGNRKGKVRTYLNKIIVFFFTGAWHGANITFVIWGLFHGAFLILEDAVKIKKIPQVPRRIYTLLVVCVGFVIFRADTMAQAGAVIKNMFTGFAFDHMQLLLAVRIFTPLFIIILITAVFFSWQHKKLIALVNSSAGVSQTVAYIICVVLLLLSVLYLSGGGYNPFIYFRF